MKAASSGRAHDRVAAPPIDGPSAARAILLGFAVVALIDAILGPGLERPATAARLAARQLWGVGSILLCGLAMALATAVIVAVGRRLGRRLGHARKVGRLVPHVLVAAATIALAMSYLREFLERQAGTIFDGAGAGPTLIVLLVAFGVGMPTLAVVANALSRRRWLRFVPIAAGLAAGVTNHLVLRDDYAEVHTTLGWIAAVLIGYGALPTLADHLAGRPRVARVLASVALVWGASSLVRPAPNALRLELFRSPGSGAYPLALALWRLPEMPRPEAPAEGAAFYASRDGAPEIAPTPRPRSEAPPVIVLITIDAMRPDLLLDRKKDTLWPTIAKLRDESVSFTRARAPGTQTAISLGSMFSGRYFSQLYWRKGRGGAGLDYPAEDASVRFPTLLERAGVATSKVASVSFLANDFGIAPGFADELVIPKNRKPVEGTQVVPPMIERLERAGDKGLFLYAHFMESHGPYSAGRLRGVAAAKVLPPGTPFGYVSYVGAVSAMDDLVAKLLEAFDRPALRGRVLFILTADHGEGFGEHGFFQHGKALNAEVMDVPLLIHGEGIAPRVVEEPVSLIDLGPTILDWVGAPTPGSYMGQSLVPTLLGKPAKLLRPIVSEGRLRRALILDDVKIIVDERRKVVEAFDLAADPGERDNLWETNRPRTTRVAAAYRAFFDAHTLRRDGYRPPYRP